MTNARAANRGADRPVSIFRIGAVANGDVILIYSQPQRFWDRRVREVNVYGQRILAAMRRVEHVSPFISFPHHSHVMLGIGGGLVIHADGKRVNIDVISDVIRHSMSDEATFRVYRRTGLSPELAQAAVKAAYRYYDQAYGFLSYFRRQTDKPRRNKDATQFCSRLVAHAYRSVGMPLTSLPDARVLPVDLYRICQGEHWQNVSDEFVEHTPAHPSEVDRIFEDMGFMEQMGMPLKDFLIKTDRSIQGAAELQKDFLHLQHKNVKDTLQVEAQLGQFVSLQLQLALALRKEPQTLDEDDAARICRVLEQLPALLGYAELPDLELIVPPPSPLYSSGGKPDTAAFVGLPAATVIHEMQMARESAKLYGYLLLAEFGMLSIASRLSNDAKFAVFLEVRLEHAHRFLAAVPPIDATELRLEVFQNGFLWVESETLRGQFRHMSSNVVEVLHLLDIVEKSQS